MSPDAKNVRYGTADCILLQTLSGQFIGSPIAKFYRVQNSLYKTLDNTRVAEGY